MAIIQWTSTTRPIAPIKSMSRSSSADCAIRNRLLFKLGIDHPRTTQGKKKMMVKGESNSRRVSYPSSTSSSSTASCSDSDDQDFEDDMLRQHTTKRRQVSSSMDSSSHYTVPLKFNQDPQDLSLGRDDADDSPSTLSEPPLCITTNCILATNKKSPKKKKKTLKKSLHKSCIQFNPQVTVIPIPSHQTYPPEIHNALYLSRTEMSVNTIRNTREFIYEGWNWMNVIEEDGMYTSKVTKGAWIKGMLVHPAHVGGVGANVVSSGNARGGGSRRRNPYL